MGLSGLKALSPLITGCCPPYLWGCFTWLSTDMCINGVINPTYNPIRHVNPYKVEKWIDNPYKWPYYKWLCLGLYHPSKWSSQPSKLGVINLKKWLFHPTYRDFIGGYSSIYIWVISVSPYKMNLLLTPLFFCWFWSPPSPLSAACSSHRLGLKLGQPLDVEPLRVEEVQKIRVGSCPPVG